MGLSGSGPAKPPAGAAVSTRGLTKVFPDGTPAIEQVDLDAAPGEFVVVLGPTGCGKTTLLRLIAGLDRATSGEVLLDGERINDQPAQVRQVAMVFQDFGLYPHLTVAENIAFPLRVGHVPDSAQRVRRVAELLELTGVLDRRPDQLSGGERQRVATGRALVREPRVCLLDEPLSNLDASLRVELRAQVSGLARRLGVTTIYVTHDQSEALTLADRLVVMRRGRVLQAGTPGEVYADPATVFVAAFLGLPRPNLVQAAIYVGPEGAVDIDLGSQVIQVPPHLPQARGLARHHADRVTLALRADALAPVPADARGPVVQGSAQAVEFHGHEMLVHLDAGVVGTANQLSHLELPEPEEDLVVSVPVSAGPRLGERLTLSVDVNRIMLFDRHGERIRLD